MSEPRKERPRIAPDGAVWVCGACGKTARDLYGDPQSNWDVSCTLNAFLCIEASLVRDGGVGRVIRADPMPDPSEALPSNENTT